MGLSAGFQDWLISPIYIADYYNYQKSKMLLYVIQELKVLKCNVHHCSVELHLKDYPYKTTPFPFPLGCHMQWSNRYYKQHCLRGSECTRIRNFFLDMAIVVQILLFFLSKTCSIIEMTVNYSLKELGIELHKEQVKRSRIPGTLAHFLSRFQWESLT